MGGAWVAAIDGGGTKTALALASRAGGVRLAAPRGGSNPQDGPGWRAVLDAVLDEALGAPGGLAALVAGLPGHGEVAAHERAVEALIGDRLGGPPDGPLPWEGINDVALAHLGAFGGAEGVLVLSGTGSMAMARGPLGFVRAGGWGDVLGDEGSAAAIGREALTLAARALDGRAPEAEVFAQALCARIGAPPGPFGPLEWLMARGDRPRAAVAGAARAVDALAAAGDPHAARLLDRAGAELALAAEAAARRAGLPAPSPWVPAGGAFASALLRRAVEDRLGPAGRARLSALGGGLLRAAQLAGWQPDTFWADRVEAALAAASAPAHPA